MVFKCCVPNCPSVPGKQKQHRFPRDLEEHNAGQMYTKLSATCGKQILHSFPRDLELYNVWVKNIGREVLLTKDPEKVRKNYRVCDIHFAEDDKFEAYHNRTNLKCGSIPTVHIPPLDQVPGDGVVLGNCNTSPAQIIPKAPEPAYQEDNSKQSDSFSGSKVETNSDGVDLTTNDIPHFESLTTLLFDDTTSGNRELCRICLRPLNIEDVVKNSNWPKKNLLQITNMISLVLPDLNLAMCTKNSYCSRCLTLLMYSYELKETWLMAEEKLQQIIKGQKKTDSPAAFIDIPDVDHCYIKQLPPREIEFNTFPINEVPKSLNFIRKVPHRRKWNFGPGPYQCDHCGMIYTHRGSFVQHILRHSKPKMAKQRHMCEQCGKQFLTSSGIKRHLEKHNSTQEKFECSRCKKIFNKKKSLQNHISHVHLGGLGSYQCHICGKQLSSRTSFRQHLLRHTGIKRYRCKVCYKSFVFMNRLKKHELVHSESKLSCEYCGKSIKHKASLANHIRVFHTSGGKNVCDICGKPCFSQTILKAHRIRIHGLTTYTQNSKNQLSNETDEGNSMDELISLNEIEVC